MRYLCTNCHYIYDEDKWELDDGIESWTKFDNLWDHYVCPVCSSYPDTFQEIKEEINYLWNIPMDFIEAEHFINVKTLDENNIKVSIWSGDYHPNWPDHRITSIWLYDEYSELVEEIFLVEGENPEVEFDISDLDYYEIRVRCSLHWVWWLKAQN